MTDTTASALPALPEAANDNRRHGRAGFHEPFGPAYTADQMRAYAAEAVRAALASQPVAPAGYKLVPVPITEQMHAAAVKVLTRAHGLDGLPQRMLDAMLAAAPDTASASRDGNVEVRRAQRPETT